MVFLSSATVDIFCIYFLFKQTFDKIISNQSFYPLIEEKTYDSSRKYIKTSHYQESIGCFTYDIPKPESNSQIKEEEK
jgi:hypothetical protein